MNPRNAPVGWMGVLFALLLFAGGAFGDRYGRRIPLHEVPTVSPSPLVVGERLVYDVRMGFVPAGTQVLEVTKTKRNGNDLLYELRSEARPSEFLSRIYRFRDRKISYVRASDLLPVRYEKDIEDRNFRGRFVVEFDRDTNHATVWKDGKYERDLEMPPFVQDELSMVYFLRSKTLRVGDTYEYTFFTGSKLRTVQVEVLSRVYYEGPPPLGKVPVYRLVGSDGFVVWITADGHRLPVKIEAPTPVIGKLVAELRSFEGVPGLKASR